MSRDPQPPTPAAPRPLKVWLAFCVFVVVGVLWLLSTLTSFASSNLASTLLALGGACYCLCMAIDPESLFRPVRAGIRGGVAARRSKVRVALAAVGLLCMLTAVMLVLLSL